MRKNHLFISAAAAMLLLVGAGCAVSRDAGFKTGIEVGAPKPEGTIDASVDAILESDDEELGQQAGEAEADEINSD